MGDRNLGSKELKFLLVLEEQTVFHVWGVLSTDLAFPFYQIYCLTLFPVPRFWKYIQQC